jgi:N-acetylglucosamine-6-phosphate deacetylase
MSSKHRTQQVFLTNAVLYAPEPLGQGGVLVDGDRIAAVYGVAARLPNDVRTIDVGGAALGPGLIDLHVHGADGVELMPDDLNKADLDGGAVLTRMARFLARHGVTGFFPATVTASMPATEIAIRRVRGAFSSRTGGARVLGIHLEGPYLSAERLGAQSPDHCVPPTLESVAHLCSLVRGMPCIATLAPEVPGGMDAIRAFADAGVVVSIGHTVADAEQAEAAFAAGATQVTHMFNGMPPMHHRRPGVVGTALATEGVSVELIADGVHLHPTTVRMAIAAKGIDRVLLVSDSMAATGCADGEYVLGPVKVRVRKGEARLESGALAGSTLTLDRALSNVARWTGGLGAAWQMASLNPARQLGIDDQVGRLAEGCLADLVVLDQDGQVALTLVGGEIVYRRVRPGVEPGAI